MPGQRSRNILHIQKVAGIAGSENHLLTLLPGLRAYGYEPTMLVIADSADHPEAFIAQMRAQGVCTDLIPMCADIDPLLVGRLVRYVRQRRFAIVHTHLFHADLYGTLAARTAGVRRLVSTKHGFAPWRAKRRYIMLNRLATCFHTRITAISQAIGQWHVQVEGLPVEKIRVVHYALDAERFRTDMLAMLALPARAAVSRPVVGTVSRLIRQKGVHVLLDAFAVCLRYFPQASLLVLGDGPERAALEEQVRRCGMARQVHFLGYMTKPAVSAMLRTIDIFALPTFGEGFGLVLLEAMAWGKPVVASHVLAIPEVVLHEKTGLLVPPDNVVALTQALLRLMQDAPLRHALGAAGRCRVGREFTVQRMVQQTVRVYEELFGVPAGDTAPKER